MPAFSCWNSVPAATPRVCGKPARFEVSGIVRTGDEPVAAAENPTMRWPTAPEASTYSLFSQTMSPPRTSPVAYRPTVADHCRAPVLADSRVTTPVPLEYVTNRVDASAPPSSRVFGLSAGKPAEIGRAHV